MELTKLERAMALSIIFNDINLKELDGHVNKQKLSDVLKVFEELREVTKSEEEKEAQINVINKLIDCLLNHNECEHKYQLLDNETTSFYSDDKQFNRKVSAAFYCEKCLDIQYQKKEIREE
ncbi:hypothetical protein [Bacillus thuringiensis]|uniref:hypothetical protein n=1 Tax=Bacillus thuringiensis TaxID=1428 RepID=UPI000A36CE93|nr:hypothetical protein [Bacillus thuringiensis]OUA87373.1 hypothetical protein BK706_18795 [Bacillus thuringiensis serovar leesis]